MNGFGTILGRMLSSASGAKGDSQPTPKQLQEQLAKNREKLQGYHQLTKDALERACTADEEGRRDAALKLYGTALEAAREGLALQLPPGAGLGPKADTAAGWRLELETWAREIANRIRSLESGTASSSAPVRPVPHAGVHATGEGAGPGAGQVQAQQRARPQQQGGGMQRTISGGGGARPAPAANGARSVNVPRTASTPRQSGGGAAGGTATAAAGSRDDGLNKYREIVAGEILDRSPGVKWDDIAGLTTAKAALTEAVILPTLRPDLFQGLRAPVRGILLYGPPGNGKTMLAKALAAESKATFFNISASSLTSKWVGDGEKLVRALFDIAATRQPSIIFMDELDSLLSSRGKAGESDAARRLLTEFLVQFDGVGGAGRERVVVVGATNRPQEIDDAVRRRLTKRIYVPLPDAEGRLAVLLHLLKGQPHCLRRSDLDTIVRLTAGYSASDLAALCKEAAMAPLRELPPARLASVAPSELRPLAGRDFAAAIEVVRPSVNAASLKEFEEFTREFGTM
ncbi:hypothetical protein HYH03_002533 [Edaphochlamys debaryana]|uniref:microtubule-severing ATPase n=1 Tax=Edaphochlamys debaryana TaxID=47281 RepID=A0A835YAZ7_9CHLO|nr:hypothetical protein HYH03_002533 [Edaphochlamys debaryana]|eukprot:KAG2499592.1 hypothetical protein HYH03_002533 [Edaphochlamys debaryana]